MNENMKDILMEKKDYCEKKILDAIIEFEESTGMIVKDIHFLNTQFGIWNEKTIAIEVTV